MSLRALVAALGAVLVLAAPAVAFRKTTREAPWRVLGVSADGRALRLGYEGGGCLSEDGRVEVTERSDRITIAIKQTEFVPEGDDEFCTSDLLVLRATARLAAPVDGRRVRGSPRSGAIFHFPGVVPRVVGLDRRDAASALKVGFVRSRVVGAQRSGVVVSQRPRAGARLHANRRSPVVRLRLRPR